MTKSLVAGALALGVLGASNLSADVLIGAAGGYKKPLTQIMANAKKAGIEVNAVFGHPKQMVQSASAGDLGLIVGDLDVLEKQKSVKIVKFTELGDGVLVFVSNKKIADLSEISNLKISYPQPPKTIYGKCASEFLKNSNLKPKETLEVASVPQVSTYVRSGDVDGGFVNITEAIAQRDNGGFATQIIVDKTKYTVPKIVSARTAACEKNADCMKFDEFLKNEQSKKILKDYGL